ncbi:unnamed protein product [Ceutorhynchus assimilis]|uniref:Major facilitator superfamily (MFS) profile domain-containing protein n=1 Tax=Ceutorhynchus assimilis TaxID=467358 RepID=A0A9N9QNG7_9CUCU|nr:unnamed protein product [Ceutorhynchus assimilis]
MCKTKLQLPSDKNLENKIVWFFSTQTMGNINPIILIYIISFMDLFAIALSFPLLAPHLQDLGASHTFIGAVVSIYSGIQVVSGPIIKNANFQGGWSDIRGRKSILKMMLLISGLCYGILGTTSSFTVIIILRIILGMVKHIQTLCRAIISDICPPDKHMEIFGKSAAISGIGFIVGPFLGGHISEVSNGFSYVSFLTMVLFFINIGVASLLPDSKPKTRTTPIVNSTGIINTIKLETSKTLNGLKSIDWTKQWEPFALRFLFSLAMTAFLTNQGLLLKEKYQLSQKYSGYVISYFSTVGTFSAYFLDSISRLFKNNDCISKLLGYYIVIILSVVSIYLTPNLLIHMSILMPISISSTALRILTMELIMQESNGDHNGSLSGACYSVTSISRFVTPLLSGFLGDIFGVEAVILIAAIPALAGVLLCLHMKVSRCVDVKEE